ncbi:enhancer of rudimentary [Cooperia oncophora]
MVHTILLIQPTVRPDSRTWSDYESTTDCLEGTAHTLTRNFSKSRIRQWPASHMTSLIYMSLSISSRTLAVLILNTETCQYVPHNKDWIKEKIFVMLRTQARND